MLAEEPKRKSQTLAMALLLVVVIAVGAGVWYLETAGPPEEPELVLTPEAKEYTSSLQLSGVTMQAHDNALGQTLVEIMGDITNAGDRPLENVMLNCVFFDINGMEIMREPLAIVRVRDGVLAPGETRSFRLPFDSIPEGWNQMMPRLVIAAITFS